MKNIWFSKKYFQKIFFKDYYFYIWNIPLNFCFHHYAQKCCFPLEILKIFFKYLILLKNIFKNIFEKYFFLTFGTSPSTFIFIMMLKNVKKHLCPYEPPNCFTVHCQAILPTHDGVITDYIVSVKRTHLGPDQMVFSNHEYRSNIISKTETRPR